MWYLFPATLGLILLLVWLTPNAETDGAQIGIWVGVVAILLPLMVIHYRAWNAPSRALERRPSAGLALTAEEARALGLSRVTYGQLTLGALMGVGMIWDRSTKTDIMHGGGLVWLFFGTGLVVLSCVQAIRKWRWGRRTAPSMPDSSPSATVSAAENRPV